MRNAEVIRQWQILREIESHRAGVTIHELARSTGVTSRTIRRDLQALQEAGFAIYDEGDVNETKRWKIDARPFQTVQDGLAVADVAALYLSRSIVEALSGWPLEDELRAAFAKLERALNPRMKEFLETLPQVVATKAGPKARGSTGPIVDAARRLLDATRDRRVIEMRYFSAQSNTSKSYVVHPYRLQLAQGGVYLVAWVPRYEAFRTFAVERIERLSVSEDTFRRTRELPPDMFSQSMGVFSGEPEDIELEFDARTALHVRGRTWHESQTVEERPDGKLRMRLRVSNDWALRSWLLGFGAGVRVIAPKTLVDAIRSELSAASAGYET
ncbi:MAG TPA: transcriptional regulator [Vicinamibacterales bacterium]|nr:transcriptional regulator [Vicinamibacterales bacterium]